MRRFEARFWIPRGVKVPIGPLSVSVEERACTVTLRGTKRGSMSGASVVVTFEEPDLGRADGDVFQAALGLGLTATNRTVHIVALLANREAAVRTLEQRDLLDLLVVETTPVDRKLADSLPLERAVRITDKPEDFTQSTQQVLDTLASKELNAHALWLDALEAAYDARPREAVVAARASIEAAWEEVASAAVKHICARTSTLDTLLTEHLADALARPLQERLDRYSRSLLGRSFKEDWGETRWSEVFLDFEVRHDEAHGRRSATEAEARRAVRNARLVLDDLLVTKRAL